MVQQWTWWSLIYNLPSVKVYIRPPHCLPVTLNKNANKKHFIQPEFIPQFYTPNLYIRPSHVSIPNCYKQITILQQIFISMCFLNKYLTHKEKSIEILLKVFPFKFVYIGKFFTQISSNWMVFKMHKECLHFNSEHSDHRLLTYHLWMFILDIRTVSQ